MVWFFSFPNTRGGGRLRRRGNFGARGAGSGVFCRCGGELLSGCPERSQRGTRGGRRGTEPAAPALPQCRPPPGPPFYGGRQLGSSCGSRKGASGMGIDVASPAAAWVGFPAWWFLHLNARLWHGGAQAARWGGADGDLHHPGALAAPQEAREGNPIFFHGPPHQGPVARWELGLSTQVPTRRNCSTWD